MAMHKASCQCGALKVEAADDPDVVVACNCKACQKRSGSPVGAAGYFKRDLLTISGPVRSWGRVAESGRNLVSHFCPECGTNVYWTLEMRPNHIGVAVGCFEAPLSTPERAIWTEEKLDWVEFPKTMPTFPQAAPIKD